MVGLVGGADKMAIGNGARATIIGAGCLAGVAACGTLFARFVSPRSPVQDVAETTLPCDSAGAALMFATAKRMGLITGVDVDRKEGLVVLVNPFQWRRQGLERQKTLAAAMDCGVAGPGHHLGGMHFRVDRSGADLYDLTPAQLYDLRSQGYSKLSR